MNMVDALKDVGIRGILVATLDPRHWFIGLVLISSQFSDICVLCRAYDKVMLQALRTPNLDPPDFAQLIGFLPINCAKSVMWVSVKNAKN
jgi:hypothetical protein